MKYICKCCKKHCRHLQKRKNQIKTSIHCKKMLQANKQALFVNMKKNTKTYSLIFSHFVNYSNLIYEKEKPK